MKVLVLPRYGIRCQATRRRVLRFLPMLAQNQNRVRVFPLFPKHTPEAQTHFLHGFYSNLGRLFNCLSNRDYDVAWVEGVATPHFPSWMTGLTVRALPHWILCDLVANDGIPPNCYKKNRTAYLTAPHLLPVTGQIEDAFVLPPLPLSNRSHNPSPRKLSGPPLVSIFKTEAQTNHPLKKALEFVAKRHSYELEQHSVTWETQLALETSKPEDNPTLAIVTGIQPGYLTDALFLVLLDRSIPVLADSRAVSPWLQSRARGFLTADDEQGWIHALDKTLGNPDFCQILGQDGNDWTRRHMNQSVYETKLMSFLEKFAKRQ